MEYIIDMDDLYLHVFLEELQPFKEVEKWGPETFSIVGTSHCDWVIQSIDGQHHYEERSEICSTTP